MRMAASSILREPSSESELPVEALVTDFTFKEDFTLARGGVPEKLKRQKQSEHKQRITNSLGQ